MGIIPGSSNRELYGASPLGVGCVRPQRSPRKRRNTPAQDDRAPKYTNVLRMRKKFRLIIDGGTSLHRAPQ